MASALWYSSAISGQWSATSARRVDWVGDTIQVSLHTSSYDTTSAQDTHDFFNDVTNEISGGNYSRQALTGKSVTYDATANRISLLAANTTFANLTATMRYAVIWKDTGTTSTSPLLGYVDLGAQSVSATNFVIDWNDVSGVLQGVTS